jgi:cystathionine gamma-synthase
MQNTIGKSTQSIWGGELEHPLFERSTQVPVVHSVSFAYEDIDTWHKVALGEEPGHIYSRNTNPTVRAFEDKVKVLLMAAMPEEKLVAASAPSSTLTLSSNALTVGFVFRE